uniref:Uncharacterized protein n=1 Tax=Avena sativa TaxID=4498 RepID=A0ACD5VT92_AVESA
MVMEEAMDSDMSLSNMVLSFFEEGETERWPENNDDDEVDEGSSGSSTAESRAFWQAQHSQLHEALAKTSTAESRIRAVAEDAMEKTRAVCSCARRAAAGECRSCMLRHVAEQLRDAGYSSAICRSKWTRSLDIPAGNWLLSRYSSWFVLRESSDGVIN